MILLEHRKRREPVDGFLGRFLRIPGGRRGGLHRSWGGAFLFPGLVHLAKIRRHRFRRRVFLRILFRLRLRRGGLLCRFVVAENIYFFPQDRLRHPDRLLQIFQLLGAFRLLLALFLRSAALLILAIFPGIAYWAANLLGFMSPINFVYIVIIFLLLVKQFFMSIRLSQLDSKVRILTEQVALDREKVERDKLDL